MDFASPLLELVKELWGLASKPLGYIYNLKHNVILLRNETEDLKTKSEDAKVRVKCEEERGGAQCTKQVENWLGKVQEFVGGVDQVLREASEYDRIKCLSSCLPRKCRSSYRPGKRVDQMLNEARELQTNEGKFSILTLPLPLPTVLEMPMDETVGLDISKFNKVWKWLMDKKQVGVIGLYGIGGVGKTALMKSINEKLLHSNNGFQVVIWVVVSGQVNEDSIRETIRKRLKIKYENWGEWSPDERVHHLCRLLSTTKFVLLIDDVWARLNLTKIGVPHPSIENGSKVVFTTRLKHVCDLMRANKTLEVQCLTPKEALKLFEKNVGKSLVDCHQEIQDLAKDIAEECKGLPLALVTVGRAMASKDNPSEWRHALRTLRNNQHKLSGMVDEVYHILEFSYNSLNDSTLQACFLYCCLFPEDYFIRTNELIELWIGEALLGDIDDVHHMRDEGESILGDLKRACLLESGHCEHVVKMHDVIRDMAIWNARDRGRRENKLLVIEKEDMSAKMISKWGEAEKVSVWGKWIRNINQTPLRCSQLETLFVREANVGIMPIGFFNSMAPCLTVLDLSGNRNIELFPEEICNLICLLYLNLSATCIRELPREIKNLTHLLWLLLDYTSKHLVIPRGAITSLPLNVFSLLVSGQSNEEEIMEEFERMQHLTDLTISVSKASSALRIFQFPNLQRSIRNAMIKGCQDLTGVVISYSSTVSGVFSHLEELHLENCPALREMECPMLGEMEITQGIGRAPDRFCFPSLVEVFVEKCGLSDLSWLVHAPKLQRLRLLDCDSLEKIIGDGYTGEELATSGLFSCLRILTIKNLPSLTSIYDQTLPFPKLEELERIWLPSPRKVAVGLEQRSGKLERTHCELYLVEQVGVGRRCRPGHFHRQDHVIFLRALFSSY